MTKLLPLEEQADVDALRESVWHAVQRGDIPDDDRARLHRLYDVLRFDQLKESAMNDGQRIEDAGGIVDIGPECFALRDGSVLSYRGENYVPQKPKLRVRIHNLWVSLMNRRR